MLNRLLIITALIAMKSVSSQEEIVTFKNLINLSQTKIKDVLPIVNQKNGDISLFFIDAKNVYGYKIDSNFVISNEVNSKRKERKYKKLIGFDILDNGAYHFYFTNKNNDKFASVKFSFTGKEPSFEELNIDLENEKFIQSINYNNNFFLITIENYKSILHIYSFIQGSKVIKNTINLTSEEFFNNQKSKDNLYNIIKNSSELSSLKSNFGISKIDEKNPNSIEITSEKVKLYQKENTVLLTLDYNKEYLQIIHIDLNDYNHHVQTVTKPFYKISVNNKKTNSFINGDYLYLIAAIKNKFIFTINNLKSGELIKSYSSTFEGPITFKNSPIIQDGGMYSKHKEMEKTKKYLHKLTSSNIGISVYKFKNDYQITLGASKETNLAPAMVSMSIGPIGAIAMAFNLTAFAFNSYSNTLSTFIICRFDNEFNHIEGDVKKNAFDKINDFKETEISYTIGESIFKYKDYYIRGNYTESANEYKLLKFKD